MIVTSVYVLVFLILVALGFWVLQQLGLPEPIRKVIYVAAVVIIVIVVVLWLLQFAGSGAAFPRFPRG